jgi:hypothetical protein
MVQKHNSETKTGKSGCNQPQEELIKYFSEATCHYDIFSREELIELTDFMFNKTTEWQLGNHAGLLQLLGNFDELFEMLKPKLRPYVDVDMATSIEGNFFHTAGQYGIHTDTPERGAWLDNCTPYKSIIIPLYLLPKSSKCGIIFYDQRIADVGVTLDKGSTTISHYDSITDYSTLDNVYTGNGKKIIIGDEPFPQKLMDEYGIVNKNRHRGLSVEHHFDWKPGSLITFDTAQVHESTPGNFITKAGLRISLMRTL